MTLLQRDRENIELGREEGRKEGYREGTLYATKILKMYNKGRNLNDIGSSLQLDPQYVNAVIFDYENDSDIRGMHNDFIAERSGKYRIRT